MNNITSAVNVKNSSVEIFWSNPQSKVIMFVDGMPSYFISLSSSENKEDKALESAFILINGGGVKI